MPPMPRLSRSTTLLFCLVAALLFQSAPVYAKDKVTVGMDVLFSTKKYRAQLKGKRVALVTNHTAVNGKMESSIDIVKHHAKKGGYQLVALFGPEHGISGNAYAAEGVKHDKDRDGIPVYSLHGETRRPTEKMLQDVDLIIFDIQDVGTRSYTYISTLFYVMEEASKYGIDVIVTDRPNPLGGHTIDGPGVSEAWRSFIGYIDVPYVHGMTVGELARYFRAESKLSSTLMVVPMKGWKRRMTFRDTGLHWVPTSPNIPEEDTPFYYPATGLLGQLGLVSIGIGYTLPFKVVGAPWLDAYRLAKHLNAQKYPGVSFQPYIFRPMFGMYSGEECKGVRVVVTDRAAFLPTSTDYLIIGVLKALYPRRFEQALNSNKTRKELFCKAVGDSEAIRIIENEKYISWKLRRLCFENAQAFKASRQKYLLYK